MISIEYDKVKLTPQVFDSLQVNSLDIEIFNENFAEQIPNEYTITLKVSVLELHEEEQEETDSEESAESYDDESDDEDEEEEE